MNISISKKLFSISAILFAFIMAFNMSGQTAQDRVFIKIEIKGLACPYCAFGMEKELKKISGVDSVDIELKEGLAYISTPLAQKPTEEALKKIIEEAGFTPGFITYSEHEFEK